MSVSFSSVTAIEGREIRRDALVLQFRQEIRRSLDFLAKLVRCVATLVDDTPGAGDLRRHTDEGKFDLRTII